MAAEALHPAASPSASSALAWAAAGMELARLERHADAALLLAHALQELDATDRVTLQEKTLQRAEWSAVHAECRFELGPCADAEASLKRALADLEAGEQGGAATSGGHAHRSPGTPGTTGADAPPRARAAAAALLLMLGRIRAKAGRLAEARADLETALARLDGLPAPSSIARTEFQLAGVLAMCGELPRALELWQRAGACFAQGDPPGPMTLRARCAMNRGLVLADLGRRAEAAAAMNEALPLVEALLLAGRGHARVDLARLLRNLGFTLGRCGEHERAIATLARAAAEADAGLRQAPLASARAALRLSRGGARNSLGYSLFALGRLDEAREALQRAVRELRPWPDAPALLRDELALARSNLAHVHAQHGELAAAQRQYGLARAHFAARAAAGEAHATVSRINAELGLARVAARQGRRAGTFAPAMAELARLTHAGQLQHEPLWLSAWLAQHEAAFGDASTAPQPAAGQAADPGRRGRRGSEDVAVLVAALAAPPRHAAGQGAHPWRALAAAAQGEAAIPLALPAARPAGIELGGAGTVGTANEAVAAAWLRFMLDWASELLTGHDPHWVREHHAEVDAAIEALRRNAERHREPAVPLAEWFLGTRGLRAQRSALADSEQPELVELREALRRLHRIEHEILGQQDDGAEAPGPAEGRGAAATAATAVTAATALPAPAPPRALEAWRQQRERTEALRAALVARGLLPPQPRLAAGQLLAALPPGRAVLLLARPQPARLLVVALVHPPGGSAAAWHRQAALDDELGRFGCATLNRLARSVWAAPSANHLPDADLFALDLFERLWQQGIAPVVRELAAAGVTALDLVPSGDLHLAPWGHLAVAVASAPSERSAQAAQPAASDTSPTWATSAGSPASAPGTVELRVLPSVGAWWACEREAGAPAVPTPRWALLAQPAPPELGALRWADVEARLSLALWGEAGMSGVELEDGGPAPPEADAALLIGHGVVPGSNAAQAGLATGARLVQPYQLLRLGRCRRALVSACLLGHTDDRSGEALGFLSGCFDHRLTFTAGWLTEVPDQAACLYSLAAQWLLRQSAAGAGRGHAAWAASLAQLRRELQCGAWPAGFGEWLAARWPRDAMEPAPPSPPAALLRALPWAVALG